MGRWEDRVGSFASLAAANSLVKETLSRSRAIVNEIVAGTRQRATVEHWFDRPTGYESYRRRYQDPVQIIDTYGVRVVITYDPSFRKGFKVITAFPVNR